MGSTSLLVSQLAAPIRVVEGHVEHTLRYSLRDASIGLNFSSAGSYLHPTAVRNVMFGRISRINFHKSPARNTVDRFRLPVMVLVWYWYRILPVEKISGYSSSGSSAEGT